MIKLLRLIVTCALVLAFFVVMLGAYTRLTDAGLGCPDWPGCYGRLVMPVKQIDMTHMQSQYPHTPIESGKAWTEMAHRYVAGTLALLIVVIFCGVVYLRRQEAVCMPWILPSILMLLVAFQAALGMWTVTLKLLPVVVMGHLLGGISIFTCLGYLWWQLSVVDRHHLPRSKFWINLGIVIVFCQIALGGWVSSNYAGIACIGFPLCNGQWIPPLHFKEAFNIFSAIGENYQGGLLDNSVRATIQVVHRLGAYFTATYLLILSCFLLWRIKFKSIRAAAVVILVLIVMQLLLGVINVLYLLPLWAAVAHNGLAALILFSLVSLRYLSGKR